MSDYTKCHSCKKTWQPYYGLLSVDESVVPPTVIYTCINCLPDDEDDE